MSNKTINCINSYLKNEPEGFIRTLLEDILNSHKRLISKPTAAEFYSIHNTRSPDIGSNITAEQVSEIYLLRDSLLQLEQDDYPQVSYQIRKAIHDYNISKEKNGLDDYLFQDNKLKSKASEPIQGRKRMVNTINSLLKDLQRIGEYKGMEYVRDALLKDSKYYQMVELLYEFREELQRDDYDNIHGMEDIVNNGFGIPPFHFSKPITISTKKLEDALLQIMEEHNLDNYKNTIKTLNL